MDREAVETGINHIKEEITGKKVLFVTTKNMDYIRNTQEINLIKKYAAELRVIGSDYRQYALRIFIIYVRLLLINPKKYDVVFIGFAPQLVLPVWRVKFRKNKVIIDFFISMYDTFVNDRKKFSRDSLISHVIKNIDKKTLGYADTIVSDTKAHGNYFVEELGASEEKLITFYLEADKAIYYPRKANKPDRLKNKFIVLYFGSVLPLQGIDTVLAAFNSLKDDNRFYFYMIGKIGQKYDKPQSSNIEYIDWLPQEKLAEYIAVSDLCLAGHFNKDIDKAKRTIPGKAYIYYAMGKKIILGNNAANRELFTGSETVFWVPMGDADALAETIKTVMFNDRQ